MKEALKSNNSAAILPVLTYPNNINATRGGDRFDIVMYSCLYIADSCKYK